MITRENTCWVAAGITLALMLLTIAAPLGAQTVHYIHTDALGSVVAVTDVNRNIIERREYEPYGAQLTSALSDGPGHTRHVQDAATGLTYMQQRYCDPVIGRFLSVDPVAADGDSGINLGQSKFNAAASLDFEDGYREPFEPSYDQKAAFCHWDRSNSGREARDRAGRKSISP
ncbi:RHS repeat domain-containing protein [Novilysobacter avium]|uniref:Teneurin-like YD-shell domain-containing protein n=1 Tax=Novilysobacter avium TaxID=2781023 RepID=A0A7S6UK69_9GAMM|nr:RHS repeat-associated core domain-containing protein [Lysobacter avium]QOW21793.1 hypothetical protein INQ42_11260 [Lysobacter avium]